MCANLQTCCDARAQDFVKSPGLESTDINDKMRLASIWCVLRSVLRWFHTSTGTPSTRLPRSSPLHLNAPVSSSCRPTHSTCTAFKRSRAPNSSSFQSATRQTSTSCCERRTHACAILLLQAVAHRIYDLYTDYVLKNPFYEVEMPIKCELFDQHLLELVRTTHARLGTLAP